MDNSTRHGAPAPDTDRAVNERSKLGKVIQDEYVAQRRVRVPQYKMNTTAWPREFWDSVARFVQTYKLPPEAWVQFVFDRAGARYPLPQELKSPALAGKFSQTRAGPGVMADIEARLVRCAAVVAREMRYGRELESILWDAELYLLPPFSFSIAVSAGRQDLAERLRPAAEAFLRQFPDYRKTALATYLGDM